MISDGLMYLSRDIQGRCQSSLTDGMGRTEVQEKNVKEFQAQSREPTRTWRGNCGETNLTGVVFSKEKNREHEI